MIKYLFISGFMLLSAMASGAYAQQDKPHHFERCLALVQKQHPGQIIKVDMKNEDNSHVYEFDIHGLDGLEWDVECDAHQAQIIEQQQEVLTVMVPAFKAKATVSEAQAKAIALAAYPGVITEVEYEIAANSSACYEFDIDSNSGAQLKIEIDASTGKIIEANNKMWQIGLE